MKKQRKEGTHYFDEDRAAIGKYAAENGKIEERKVDMHLLVLKVLQAKWIMSAYDYT